MASKIFTTNLEESFINTLIYRGFKFNKGEIPKYTILRLAISKAFKLEYKPLNDPIWTDKVLKNDQRRGGEYNLIQVTGTGKEIRDYDKLLRVMFSFRHKDENLDFNDESVFVNALTKYINRGLYEIYNTYKTNDDFYQYLIDEFGIKDSLNKSYENENPENQNNKNNNDELDENKNFNFEKYLNDTGINFKMISIDDAIRHKIYRIKVNSEKDYKTLNSKIPNLKNFFGLHGEASMQNVLGNTFEYEISIPKPPNNWTKFELDGFWEDILKYDGKFNIAAYLGRTIENIPFYFDLSDTPHLFIAGTTGSGKTRLIDVIINSVTLLNKNRVEFIMIDPKKTEFIRYKNLYNLSSICGKKIITDMDEVENILNEIMAEMEHRNEIMSKEGVSNNKDLKNPFKNLIVLIDELADLFKQDKNLQIKIEILAAKARSSGINLILSTQTPNSDEFSQSLRSNIPSRIALRTTTAAQSKVILDEYGAEGLLGKGDLYVKLKDLPNKIRVISPFLSDDDIKKIIIT